MAAWRKHRDTFDAVVSAGGDVDEFGADLLKCLAGSRVAAFADQAFYTRGNKTDRQKNVALPAAVWSDVKRMFEQGPRGRGGKELMFNYCPSSEHLAQLAA